MADRPHCVVCGTASAIESNHLAARANDRALVVPMCKACHDLFTDWQWALGILRRESLEDRAAHSEGERAWALFEGFALIALMAGPVAHRPFWLDLARAAGVFYKIREEEAGREDRWGPRPSRGRVSRGSVPERRWTRDPALLLGTVLLAGDRWLSDDPAWPALRKAIAGLGEGAAGMTEVPIQWRPAVDGLVQTLAQLAHASGPDELDADRARREATLVAIRSLFAMESAASNVLEAAVPRKRRPRAP